MTRIEHGNGWEMRLGRWQDSPPNECDHVISDPPFSAHVHSKTHRYGTATGYREHTLTFDSVEPSEVVPSLASVATRWIVCFCSIEHVGVYADVADATESV